MKKLIYKIQKAYSTPVLLVLVFTGSLHAQQALYNGGNITVQSGASVTVLGGVVNQGTGLIENDGLVSLTGDWTNNASNNTFTASQGTVEFNGNTQTVSGSSSTHFPSLKLLNGSTKLLQVNTQVDSVLYLNDCIMDISTYQLRMYSTDINAVSRTTGYVQNSTGGLLTRRTATIGTYEFPLGSSVGVVRYRPVSISPVNASSNEYAAGFYNHSAGTDGYTLTATSTPTCYINHKFYHKIERVTGSTGAAISLSFDNVQDSVYSNAVNWSPSVWNDEGTVTLTSNTSPVLSKITVPAFNQFNNPVHALSINTIPNSITAVSSTTFCQGDTVVLQSQYIQSGYQWYRNGNPISGATADTVIATLAGVYTLEASNGICTVGSSNSITVTVNAAPDASFSTSSSSVCENGTSIGLTPNQPGGSFSGTGVSGTSFDPASLSAGNYTITYSITDVNNCTASSTQQVTVNALPDASFTTSSSSTCTNGMTVSLTPVQTGGSFSGTGVTGNIFDPAALSSGNYTITYTISNVSNCSAVSIQQITVNASPDASFSTSSSAVCENGTAVNLTANQSGGSFSGTGVSGNTFDPASLSAGNYTITYTITDANNCTASSNQQVTVNALPDAGFTTSSSSTCMNGTTVTLTPDQPGGSFSGTGVSGTIFDPASLSSGNYTVTYSITDVNNCSAFSSQQITIHTLPDAGFSTSSSTVCENGLPVSLTASQPGGSFSGTGVSGSSFDPASLSAGNYTITYTITDANNCTASSNQQVTVNAIPDASFTVNSPVCENASSITLVPTVTGGTFTGTGVSGTTFDPAVSGAGTFSVTYSITDANGCSNQSVEQVTVNSLPVAAFNASAVMLALNGTSTSANATTLNWDFGDGNTATGGSVSHNYAQSGTYTITLIATNACGSDTTTQQITVSNGTGIENNANNISVVLMPNPFTDALAVQLQLTANTNIQLEVYDLLGQKIYTQAGQEFAAGSAMIDLSHVFAGHAPGNYFIRLNAASGWTRTIKTIKSSLK